MKLQESLRFLRKKNNLSQETLAEILGVSRQAVAKWEAGLSFPDIENLLGISDYFKISIDRLVKETDVCVVSQVEKKSGKAEEIKSFLCRAKRSTYAGKGNESKPSRVNSHDYLFTEDNLTYIDTYIGGERFSGEEAIWIDEIPHWSMNYFGRVISEEFSGDFLKEVLLLVKEENPYRGPYIYQSHDYQYHCMVAGDFEWFRGEEEIFHKNKKVYECMFHGGYVK